MKEKTFTVTLTIVQPSSGKTDECIITFLDIPPWDLVYSDKNHQELTFIGSDLWGNLLECRKFLEKEGWLILCNGARKDVWPSGMSRSMGGGRLGYIRTMGQAVSRKDLVNIFREADIEQVGTAEEQETCFNSWATIWRNRS